MTDNNLPLMETKPVLACPYCQGKNIVKKGARQKKHESVQLYYCTHCNKKFTPLIAKHKTFPLKVIIDALTHYNRFYNLESAAEIVSKKYGITINRQNISKWLEDFKEYLTFSRMRDYIDKNYEKKKIFVESQLFHGQIYRFKYHRAKTELILDDSFKHNKYHPLREYLELVTAECPHQIFKESTLRASEYKNIFNLDGVKITPKDNYAVKNSRFVLQAVANNKLRHEVLQEFMLVNDSVTVATEVPVLLDKEDLLHYKCILGFNVPLSIADDERITGHIDLVQIRNGLIYIMDFKPGAKKEKPIEQLTIYALALSRLTGLRLYHFACAWFDDENYYEFFPLHVVYKKQRNKKDKKKEKNNTEHE
ncbi:MAG: PD-(D/E)XK nuclease family protein [Candidatus Margulisiibacteriota bacterium]